MSDYEPLRNWVEPFDPQDPIGELSRKCPDCGKHPDLCGCEEMRANNPNEDFDDWDEDETRDRTCPECNGTGGDRWDDGITPCPHCDGEGYVYWLP